MSTESQLVHDVLAAWGAHPRVRIARINTGAAKIKGRLVRFGVPGTGDIVGLIAPDGRMLMIECKSATGKQRKEQRAMQRVIEKWGGIYILALTLNDVDRRLAALGVTR